MTFLNPLVLLGLIAAAIPLIIHLFNFRRPRRVDFSSLAFLRELQKTTMQRVRIKQWLLLLLRTLALACLVLAFARPTLRSGLVGNLGGRVTSSVALVVDNSLSMTQRDAHGSYLDQAREMAAGVVAQMAPGDEAFVVTTADPGSAPTAPMGARGSILDALRDVEAAPGAGSGARALARAAALLENSRNLNREIYFVTDLQRSTLLDSVDTRLSEHVRVVLLPVGERTQNNVAVTAGRVVSRIVEEGQPARIEATLVNYGTERLEDFVASVYLDGDRVAQTSADLEPGAPTPVQFTVTPRRRGWLAGVVQIEADAFESDDAHHFTMQVPERRRLLLVRGDGQRLDYLTLALSPELTRGRVTFDVETVDENALASRPLQPYDAVILVGPRSLSAGEVGALVRYVEEGGGLFFSPAPAAQPADYNALFGALGGGRVAGFSGSLGSGRSVAAFDRVELEHPLFEGVFEASADSRGGTRVESPEVYYTMNYAPAGRAEQTLIRLTNGLPFLQEIRRGRGVVLLNTVAPDPQWSDLPVRGVFIPLLYRSVYYLSSSEAVQGEQYVAGAGGELRLTGVTEAAAVRLVGPGGQEYAPGARGLFGALLVEIDPSLRTPGIYDVKVGASVLHRVAVNNDPHESDLAAFPPEEARDRLARATGAPVRVLDLDGTDAGEVVEAIRQERTGVEIWNVFLWLALTFLVAEMLVARQWRPEAAPA